MLDRRPRANAWSQTEILAHLADFEVICFQARVETILAGLPVIPMKLGEITLGNLLAEWVIHDLSHLRQLVMAAAEAFLPAAGPWRPAYPHLELRTAG